MPKRRQVQSCNSEETLLRSEACCFERHVWREPPQSSKRRLEHHVKKKSELQEREVEDGVALAARHANARLHRLMCDETELSTQLAHSFGNLDLQRAWFAYVPRYVGENKAVDSAVRAVIIAWRNRRGDTLPASGVRHYAHAIQELRTSLDSSDLSLLCVALMANFETVTTAAAIPPYPHIQGLTAIINARPRGFHKSEVARAVLYTFSDELFRLACARNTPHPLDTPRHRDIEPPSRTASRDEAILSLRRTGFRLYVRLPRFI